MTQTQDTEDVVARRAAIRDILYRLLPQEIDANICRAIADEFLSFEASDRQSLSDRIDELREAARPFAESIVIDPTKKRGDRHWATCGKLTNLDDVLRLQDALDRIATPSGGHKK